MLFSPLESSGSGRLAEAEPTLIAKAMDVSDSGMVYIQLGAFTSNGNALSLRDKISRDLDWLEDPIQINRREGLFRVQLGPYENRDLAEQLANQIDNALGYRPTLVIQE